MQFSESWLRQFVDPALSTQELSHVLTMSGLEVEETKTLAPPFKQVVVAQILEATQHPDADRLKVCQVSVGESSEPLQIVCGAPNARAGIKIPCALVGAELPAASAQDKPFLIRVGKLRGVQSYGMLCSGRELGLGDDHAGILELPQDAPLGTDIREYLGLDDTIFTIKLTPNKADCLSVAGIAREVAALTSSSLKVHQPTIHAVSIDRRIDVKIEEPNLCGRFAGRVITQVNAKAVTPAWMVRRLASAGQRSISALVDISNYVMLEMGQPTHIFDLEKISGDLTVRWAKDGESVRLLNGQDLTIQSKGLPLGVISDQRGIESIAGIMGGDYTAVTLETQDIYVESAFWWPSAIQGRARALNFSTDAAYRFERGVDPSHVVTNLHYVTELILQICGGQLGPVDDQVIHLPQLAQVPLRVARVAKIIGLEITGNQIADYFDRLGFTYTRSQSGTPSESFAVQAPAHRFDIAIEEDLIEEIARLYGFENIPEIAPSSLLKARPTFEKRRSMHALRHRCASQDYQEVVNYGFIDAQTERTIAGNTNPIEVLNPLAEQFAVMRSSLVGSLLNNLQMNVSRGATRVRIFEIGRVFKRDLTIVDSETETGGFLQDLRFGGLAYGQVASDQWAQTSRWTDFFDVKGDLERIVAPLQLTTSRCSDHPAMHPGRGAVLLVASVNGTCQEVGFVGELHPRLLQDLGLSRAPIVFELSWSVIEQLELPKLSEISKYPLVERDIALVVHVSTPAQDILNALRLASPSLVKHIHLFDEFKPTVERPSGMALEEKSLAFRLVFEDLQQTLQDQQVESTISSILEQVLVQFSARLR